MTAYVKSEIKFNLDFCKTNLITKDLFNKFTLNKLLLTDNDEINYISVVLNLNKLNNIFLSKLARLELINCSYEALIYCYADIHLKPQIEELSAPLQQLTLKILKAPHLSKDYIKSCYAVLPQCYK